MVRPKLSAPFARHLSKYFLVLVIIGLSVASASATIQYKISLAQPETHLFHVSMTIPNVRDAVTVQLPVWNATYQIRDFAMRVQQVRATDEHAKSLAVRKLDTSTWRVTGSGTITVTYAILWDDPGPFAAQLNNSHAFMNLAMICFYDQDRRNEDISLAIQDLPANWHIATPLRAGNAANTFVAAKYDELVDSPIECGTFQEFELEGITPPVHVVVHGNNWDRNQLADGLARIVRSETSMMGGAPYSQYTFIFHFGNGGGGMEHANGTAIGSQSTNGAISTAAHEFFHLWNVKRIRPQTLEPVDYSKEMPTRALWFAEGVTSTYGSYTLVRSDLWSQQQFYADLGGQITQLESRPARQWQSVEESSLDAWLEKYPIYNGPDFSVNYYNKGQLDGVMLDVLIRDATNNHKSLDDLMRAMNDNFAKRGRFYNDSADIEATAESVAGISLKDFFAKYVAGTDEIPFAEILSKAGMKVIAKETPQADLGMEIKNGAEGATVVASVTTDGAASRAGIQENDILDSANGAVVPAGGAWRRWLSQLPVGEAIKMRVRRGTQMLDIEITPGAKTGIAYRVEENPDATEKQKRIRDGMLHGTNN